jgi:enolase
MAEIDIAPLGRKKFNGDEYVRAIRKGYLIEMYKVLGEVYWSIKKHPIHNVVNVGHIGRINFIIVESGVCNTFDEAIYIVMELLKKLPKLEKNSENT